jgi:hypothetical protein
MNEKNDKLTTGQANPGSIDAAVRKAMREAVLMHARLGNSVCTWKDGRVVWLSPQEVFELFASEPPSVPVNHNPNIPQSAEVR